MGFLKLNLKFCCSQFILDLSIPVTKSMGALWDWMKPVQWIFRLWDDEQSVNGIEDISHGDLSVVVPVKYVVADTPHTVNITVVHLESG